MNKKILFYFLTALVVLIFKTDSCYSFPTISKYNVEWEPGFWTPEKIKRAKPMKRKNIGFRTRSGEKTKRNTTNSSISIPPSERKSDIINDTINVRDDQFQSYPIGLLIISNAQGDIFTCTASVINTFVGELTSGNIALTAAHCLFDPQTQAFYNNIVFAPGYDRGETRPAPFNAVQVVQAAIPHEFRLNNDDHFDLGMVRFDFNLDGQPLQHYTGSLGYQFNLGDNVQTTIRGYPNDGELENCPNDGENLCTWNGVTRLNADYYAVPDLELGQGASGAPLITNYDPNTNLGILYSNYASFDGIEDDGLAPIYDQIQFQALISDVSQPFKSSKK